MTEWSHFSGPGLGSILLWGLVATVAMTTILSGSQGMGLSRLSLPFLLGTCFSGNRRRATVLGFVLYVTSGWIFAGFYLAAFVLLDKATWWLGAIGGCASRHAVASGLLLALVIIIHWPGLFQGARLRPPFPIAPSGTFFHPASSNEQVGASRKLSKDRTC